MATLPTRAQQQAGDLLAEALFLITEGSRLDGRAALGAEDLAALAARLAKASSVFGLAELVNRALTRRVQAMKLRPGTADLLVLLDGEIAPLELLRFPDDEFRAVLARLEEELGEV